MKRKEFTLYVAAISAVMGALVGEGVATGNIALPLAGIITGVILIAIIKRRVTEVIEDERIYRLSEKASRATLQIFAPAAAVAGLILITLKKFVDIGYTLSFSVCILLVLYLTSYAYYNRRGLE